jgi:negative regulator of genetic competence, sporulation and motility
MDLIKISDNKLKIMLTPVDMQSYEISISELDCTNVETREAFRSIMNEARDRIGFDTGGNQIYVQVYPSREGGCEMFVTKLGLLCPMEQRGDATTLPRTLKSTDTGNHLGFGFEGMEHLLAACRRLCTMSFEGGSSAYRTDEGRYYLLLDDRSGKRPPLNDRDNLLSVMEEYGTRQNAEAIALYIREHADVICECEAVARLAEL